MGKKSLWKKILVYATTFMMLFSTMPVNVFADTEQNTTQETPNNSEQIGAYYEVDDKTGAIPDSPTLSAGNTEQDPENGNVKLNKTIEATDEENVFKITLDVTTVQDITQITKKPSAATVIVIDASRSMSTNEGRVDAARKAAQAFINGFADTNDNDDVYRKVAIVEFSGYPGSEGNPAVDGATTLKGWTEASDLDGYDYTKGNYCEPVNEYNARYAGTNIDAGLKLAENLLKMDAVKDISSKNIVLISDGAPTYCITNDSKETSTLEVCNDGSNMSGDGQAGQSICALHDNVVDRINDEDGIKDKGINIYAAYIGSDYVKCTSCGLNMLGSDWLKNVCLLPTESVADTSKLVDIFQGFISVIEKNAQAWNVTDPMGPNMEYIKASRNSYQSDEITFSNGELQWNLKKADHSNKTTVGGKTTYSYSLSYLVRLDNITGYQAGTLVNTNNVTKLQYAIQELENNQEVSYSEGTAYFNVPSVKGLVGEYEFSKVDEDGNPVRNAEFTLTHTCDTCSYCSDTPCSSCKANSGDACEKTVPEDIATATSDANGKVKFTNIPSGHTYKLTETSAPSGFKGTDNEYEMTVSYGNVTVTGYPDGLTVVNEEIPIVNVEGEKTWVKEGTGNNPSFQISLYGEYQKNGKTYYLYTNNGNLRTSDTKRAYDTSSSSRWSWTNLTGVYDGEVVNWHIEETIVPSGYTPVVDGWDVTNIQDSGKDYIGKKIWVGDEEGDRPTNPADLNIALYVEGQAEPVRTDVRWVDTEGDTWIFMFEDIEKFDANGAIRYYAKEGTVPGGYIHTSDMVDIEWPEKGNAIAQIDYSNQYTDNYNDVNFNIPSEKVGLIVGDKANSNKYTIWTTRALTDAEKSLVLNDIDAKKKYRYIPTNINSSNLEFKVGTSQTVYREGSNSRYAYITIGNNSATIDFTNASLYTVWSSYYTGTITFDYEYKPGTTTITNTVRTEDVTVKKSWNDNNDEADMRPESIVVTLTGTTGTGNSAETIVTEDVTLSESNNWEYKWTGLRDYKNGKDVVYTVKEKGTSNYYVTSGPVMNEDGDYVITNTFTPDPTVPVEISGTKTLTGRQMKSSDSFTFNIEGADEATKAAITAGDITGLNPVTINGTEGATDKVFTFSGITFKKAGEYEFNITESKGTIPGVDYDNSVVTVTVNVAYSKADGRLKATVTYPENSGLQFTNEYSAEPAEITLDVSKTLTGRDWINADEFTFELKALKGGNAESITLPDPVTITKATDKHKATFGKLVFDKAGTYKFVVTEVAKSGDGITYDKSEKIVTVVVNDNGKGKLTAAVDADQSDVLAFTNIYDAADITVQLNGTKQLEGATLTAGAFEFSITAVTEGAPMPASGKVTNDAEGVVNFGDIVFSKAGTYVYEITEIAGKDANVKYDGGKVTATVTVTENKENGTLSASVTYSKNDGEVSDSFVFKNEYYADAKPISLVATKSLGGVAYGETPEFTFVLTPAESNASTDPISSPVEVKLNGEGTITLVDEVVYTEPGTYVYTVSERQGSILNMTYDTQPVEITVVVTENKTTHKLDTVVTYKKNNEKATGIAFANTYSPEGTDAIIGGFKTVSGNKQLDLDTERFKFTIEAVTPGAPLPEVSTVENNNAGEFQFQFGKIEYTAPGVYEYQVTEVQKVNASEMPGYTYDDNVYTVIVTITDENGKLVSDVEYKDDGETVNGMYFDNVYRPKTVKASVEGSKVMDGRDLKDGESYEFRIAAITSGAPLPADTTAASGNDGTFEFGDITFDKAGRYEYSITEVDGTTPGVEYSTEVYKAVIVVRDNIAEGKLEIESVKYFANDKEVNEVVFTNEYKPAAIKAVLRGDKTLKGRAMAEGESFTFKMEAANNSTEKAIEDKVITGFNETASVSGGANGEAVAFDFEEMTFNAAGEYKFNIEEEEIIPDKTNGITYDDKKYEVVVTVTDDENGYLHATVSYGEGNTKASFVNKYSAESTSAQITATKQLKKAELEKDAFTFTLTDEDGNKVTAKNDAKGNVVFDLEYDKAGTYTYTLFEKAGTDKNITYDATEHEITVTVTDDGKGQLNAVVTYPEAAAPEFTNTYNTISIPATKVWNDANNQDGKRPESITFNLMNGDEVVDSKELTGGILEVTFDGLPEFDADGNAINYTVVEVLPEGTKYTSKVTGSIADGFVVTNSYSPEETAVTVKKVWDDNNDQDGKRPETLKVTLSNGQEVTLSEANGWEETITGLPKYADGKEIIYTWQEETIHEKYSAGYAVTGTVTTITNTYPVETTEATVKKVWNDNNDQDNKRPEHLTVTLSNGQQVTLNESNNWTTTVTNLPKYENKGQLIEYTWTEDEDGLPEGYELTSTSKVGTVTTLTNSYTPEVTEAEVVKVWDDNNNQDGKRPESIKATLSNGTEVTLSEANDWRAKVSNLPKYANGVEIEYTWTESEVPEGYTLTGNSKEGTVTTLTNSHIPEKTEVTVKKIWDDTNNQDGMRPESLTVTLSNGTEVILNEANDWTATVTDLPKYKDGGVEIEYSWTEGNLPEGYELTDTSVEGTVTTLTNTHTPAETEATIKKVWDDADNQDGKRPAELTVILNNGTEDIGTVTLNEDNNWTETVGNLPKFAAGKELVYVWAEGEMPEGYALTATSSEGTVTTLTNSYEPEVREATVTKIWEDTDDQDGKRPENLTVTLNNGTEDVETVTLSEDNQWSATVENLPVYEAGELIEYTWTEADAENYELTATAENGTITLLTNSHVPETTELTVYKNWKDKHDKYDKRPEEITVYLEADGEIVQTVQFNEADKWRYTFSDLPVYADGEEIIYTISEEPVEGYITEIDDMVITNTIDPEELDDFADTGDDSKPWAYGFAGLMAMLTAAGALFLRRRED